MVRMQCLSRNAHSIIMESTVLIYSRNRSNIRPWRSCAARMSCTHAASVSLEI